jgi:hypothetical protein
MIFPIIRSTATYGVRLSPFDLLFFFSAQSMEVLVLILSLFNTYIRYSYIPTYYYHYFTPLGLEFKVYKNKIK